MLVTRSVDDNFYILVTDELSKILSARLSADIKIGLSSFLENSSNRQFKNSGEWHRLISIWISFPEIGLCYDPVQWNFGHIFGWVFQGWHISVYWVNFWELHKWTRQMMMTILRYWWRNIPKLSQRSRFRNKLWLITRYIEVDVGCWSRNQFVTASSCWWQFWVFFTNIQSFHMRVGHQHSKNVTNIENQSSISTNCHQFKGTNITLSPTSRFHH